MMVEIVRDHGPRWVATDANGIAIGYGGTIKDAVMRWAKNWDTAQADRLRELTQTYRLDASVE